MLGCVLMGFETAMNQNGSRLAIVSFALRAALYPCLSNLMVRIGKAAPD
jgi:hypothetical protein